MMNGSNGGGRVNIDALDAIVKGHGDEIGEIRTQISGLGNRMDSAFVSISTKIDNQQQATWNQQQAALAGSKTNGYAIMGAVGTAAGVLVSVFVVVGSMALGPIKDRLDRHDFSLEKVIESDGKKVSNEIYIAGLAAQQVRNLALEASTTEVNKTLNNALIAQAYVNGYNVAQSAEIMRSTDRNEKASERIDGQLVKRPELDKKDAHVESRLDAVSARQTWFESWLQGVAPGLKEVIGTIETRLDRLTFPAPPNGQLPQNYTVAPPPPPAP